jgi:hypothetical protein
LLRGTLDYQLLCGNIPNLLIERGARFSVHFCRPNSIVKTDHEESSFARFSYSAFVRLRNVWLSLVGILMYASSMTIIDTSPRKTAYTQDSKLSYHAFTGVLFPSQHVQGAIAVQR